MWTGYVALVLIANPVHLQAQTTYTNGDLTINHDGNSPSNVAAITTITGNLTIHEFVTTFPDFAALKVVEGNVTINDIQRIDFNLTDIFPVLDSIRGNFVIENTPAEELSGLEELDSIGGNLHILSNTIGFLPEFAELDKIGGSVNISGNQILIDCCGLLKFLDGSVSPAPSTTISNNSTGCNTPTEITNTCLFSVEIKADADIPADMSTIKKIVGNLLIRGPLTRFPTFPALEVVEGNIIITDISQNALNNLFPALDSVRGILAISGNSQTISGLEELDSIGGGLFIFDNANLMTLSSFSNLKFIEKGLFIQENSALTALPSFAALTRISGGVVISNNAQLTDCCGIHPFTASAFFIFRNARGCNNVNEIEINCTNPAPPGPNSSATLLIDDDSDIPDNVTAITHITGDLTIGGTITTFPDFTALEVVLGDIIINGITTNTLTNLTAIFPALTTISGHIDIESNNNVQTITGFSVLKSGGLSIENNATLTTISGFSVLESGGLFISNNPKLATIPTFTTLTSARRLSIENNDVLRTISGFGSLQTIVSGLTINDNALLRTISGFDALKKAGFISIHTNVALTTISGFGSLQTIVNGLTINDNALLRTISGFDALSTIEFGGFAIEENTLLTTISGFDALSTIGGDFTIENNTSLSSCCDLRRFVDGRVEPSGSTTIRRNAAGCNSVDEIRKADCPAVPVLGLPTLANDIRFYPNPASQTLYIEGISQETALFIRTFSGKTLLRTSLRQNQAIDLASLPQGIYLLTLQSSQENAQEQFQAQITRRLVIGL